MGCLLGGSIGDSGMREAVSDYLKSYKEETDALKPCLFLWKPCNSTEGEMLCDLGRAFLNTLVF